MTTASKATKCGNYSLFGRLWLLVFGTVAIYCFVKGAIVDDSSATSKTDSPRIELRPIQEIKAGQRVMAFDPETGQWSPHRVVHPLVHDYDGDLITIRIPHDSVEATGNHPFWVVAGADLHARPAVAGLTEADQQPSAIAGRWVEARHIKVGDVLLIRGGQTAKVEALDTRHAKLKVYNLEVADVHTYSVGKEGILVHNKPLQIAPLRITAQPYGDLSGNLRGGVQANHLNQNAVFKGFIPEEQGLAVSMRGNAFTEPGTPHYNFHQSLERFWDQFRDGGARFGLTPTNMEYNRALQQALTSAGYSGVDAADLTAQAARQQTAFGLSPGAPVPRVPGRMNQVQP